MINVWWLIGPWVVGGEGGCPTRGGEAANVLKNKYE